MGAVKSYKGIEFWAENGVVYLVDTEAASKIPSGQSLKDLPDDQRAKIIKGLPPKVFLKRAYAAAACDAVLAQGYPSEERKLRQFVDDFRSVYKEACEQGAFDDPKVSEYKLRHPSRKPRIIVPNETNSLFGKSSKDLLLNGTEVTDR
jgi:hypothetical protein